MQENNKRKNTTAVIIHCSETLPELDLGGADIDRLHRIDGRLSCGYHKIIRRDGTVENGRRLDLAGLHLQNTMKECLITNQNSIGICLIGGKPDCNFTIQQFIALETLIKYLKKFYGEEITVLGYRDVSNSPSPHFDVKEFLGSSPL